MPDYPIALVWPNDLPDLVCIAGQYERVDGQIVATYNTSRELSETLASMLASERTELEARLERGLEMIGECADGQHLARLLQRLGELLDRHQRILDQQRLVEEHYKKGGENEHLG